jgi:hypothetical protein
MKKNFFKLFSLAVLGFAMVSCSNPSKMAKEAMLIGVDGNPKVLEVVADEITASYSITFPEGYFHPKAILEVVPVLVYEGGEQAAPTFKLQGEKVTDNFPLSRQRVAKPAIQLNLLMFPAWKNRVLSLEFLYGISLKRLTSQHHLR